MRMIGEKIVVKALPLRPISVSQSHLRALFEKWLGESPKQYHTHYRIDQAKRLLCEQHLSIFEVAFQVGFTDARHFSRVFKQVIGVSPVDTPDDKLCNLTATQRRFQCLIP